MLDILSSYGAVNINATEIMQGMAKRGTIHFNRHVEIRSRVAMTLGNAIEISDAHLRFGLARLLLETAIESPSVSVRSMQPLPQPTQDLVNAEVRQTAAERMAEHTARRREIAQNSAGRVLIQVKEEGIIPILGREHKRSQCAGGDPRRR